MAYQIVRLPNGRSMTVTPVFGGFFFKSNDLNSNNNNNVSPVGWTIILESEDDPVTPDTSALSDEDTSLEREDRIHRFKKPTLCNDNLFISSISNPSNSEYKAALSPTRQMALILWVTLYWYFQQPEPPLPVDNASSKDTPVGGKPRGEWRINIKRQGVFRGRNLLQKLERMCLITCDDSSVGLSPEENNAEGWEKMFTSRRAFWQLSPSIFLFTLQPADAVCMHTSTSRSSSPAPCDDPQHLRRGSDGPMTPGLRAWSVSGPLNAGQFASSSHLPTYFPPPPLQYKFTNGIRHPSRPKPPRQGEIFYMRFIESVGQYLSFRVASLSQQPVPHIGAVSTTLTQQLSYFPNGLSAPKEPFTTTESNPDLSSVDPTTLSDTLLLNKWMNQPRVSAFWGCAGPTPTQAAFLTGNMKSTHSFPVIASWDGVPFGYMEVYWAQEDGLGRLAPMDDFDRGVHVLVGEESARGKAKLWAWMTGLVHWCFLNDMRTQSVVLEPRVDNVRWVLLRLFHY